MIYTDNAINILAARTYKGIGRAWIVKNISSNMGASSIVNLLKTSAKVDYDITIDDFNKKKEQIKSLLEKNKPFIDGVIAIGDDNFPEHRGYVKNSEKPIFLFYRGDIKLLGRNSKNIAVIGLLTPSLEIEKMESHVVDKFVSQGAVIISGLALGCDSIAHWSAIRSGGKTVAILPSPLSNITPSSNKHLADEIVRTNGLLLTEYLTDAKSKIEFNSRYQERDRLQALFSDGIVLSASYAKNDLGNDSGSRLAMGYALEYKIPRGVIYNAAENAKDPKFDLSRQCISEEQNSITIIDKSNLDEAIAKMLTIKENKSSAQQACLEF